MLIALIIVATLFVSSCHANLYPLISYWGQNAINTFQAAANPNTLLDYCKNSPAEIFIISFVDGYNPLHLNLTIDDSLEVFPGTSLLNATQYGEDIIGCQKLGKIILLGIGGENAPAITDGKALANTLWSKFGPFIGDVERPFGSAIVDGFDLELSSGDSTGTVELAEQLRENFLTDASRGYILGTSPNCIIPDPTMGGVISEVPMDFTLVKYNLDDDKCSIYNNFNYHDWSTLAKVSPDPNNAIIVDIPAGIVTFPEEHQSLPQIIYDVVGCDSNFGGIGVWDISIANSIEEDKQLENYLQNYYRYCYPLVNITVPSQSNSKSASFISSSMIANAESSFRDASTSTMVYMNNSIQGVSSYGALNSNKGTNVTMTTESSTRVATITSCAENKCSSIPMVTINGSTNHLNINISSTTNQVAVGSLTLTQINNSSGIKSYNCIALMVLGICVTFF